MPKNQDKTNGYLLPNVTTCIVACSAAEARLFLSDKRFGDWVLLDTLKNPDATLREQDLTSDRPGRAFDRFGRGRHAMSPAESAHEHELVTFAHEISQQLAKAHAAGQFSKLVLIADPSFLGHLRQKLPTALKRVLHCEVPKNPAEFDRDRLRSLFT